MGGAKVLCAHSAAQPCEYGAISRPCENDRGIRALLDSLLDEGGQTPVTANELQSAATDGDDPEADALYDEAVHYVCKSRRASISSVQRKLRIGYNRAARLIETMEAAGVVSEMGSNGQREVLAPPPVED